VRWILKKAAVLLATYHAYMLEYRGEIFFWLLSGITPFFFMAVWMEAAGQGYTEISTDQYARYFFFVFLTRQLSLVWVSWNLSESIRTGTLSFRLLQPLDPLWHHLADHVAERGVRLPLMVPIFIVFTLLYPGTLVWPGWERALLGLVAVALAFLTNFFASYTLGLLALWFEDAAELSEVWNVLITFFSGMLAPLSLYPQTVQNILAWTPFPYLVYLPSALWSGMPVAAGWPLVILLGWTLLFYLVSRGLWRLGLKHYSAMGA